MSTTASTSSPTTFSGPSLIAGLATAAAVGLAIGVTTAYGQGWLGDAAGSLANSAGPWSIAAFIVARYTGRLYQAVAGATLTLACSEIGYVIATEVRGGSSAASTVTFWLAAAAIAGPPLGVAASWSTGHGLRRGIGFAVIGGVLIGEGGYGWSTVAATTDGRYWALELLIGVALVLACAARSRRAAEALAIVATAALTATVVCAVGRVV